MELINGLNKKRLLILLGIFVISIILLVVIQKTNLIYYLITTPLQPGSKVQNQASATFEDEEKKQYTANSNIVTTTIKETGIETIKIKIKVKPEGKTSFASTLTLKVLAPGTENSIFQATGNSDNLGKLEVETTSAKLPAGTYDFRIVIPGYLSKKITNLSWPTEQEIEFANFLAGDLNNDNKINTSDWAIMSKKWGATDPLADINQDGIVNAIDWSFMAKNWGQTR